METYIGNNMNAAEIRRLLESKYSVPSTEVAEIKGITALRERLTEEESLTGLSSNGEFEFEDGDEDKEFAEEAKDAKPEMNPLSKDWQDHVMDMFQDSELEKWEGQMRPNIHGLRRVSQVVFGYIISSDSDVIQSPNPGNKYHAVVKSTIEFQNGNKVSDVADIANHDEYNNTELKYARHATSTAATKAEARALRKILQLNFISAEESTPDNLPDIRLGKISEQQVLAFDTVCKRFDVNVIEFVNSGEKHYTDIKQMSNDAATQSLAILNDPEKRESFLSSRDGIKGYQANWKELFHE